MEISKERKSGLARGLVLDMCRPLVAKIYMLNITKHYEEFV
jgi:hypothetical protein